MKFDKLPKAATHVIEFTLDDIYPPMDSSGWLKSGQMCVRTPLLAPGCKGYRRTTTMNADASIVGQPYGAINTYMRQFGFDFTEHPNCTGGFGGHIDGVHGAVDLDDSLMRHVFRFDIHIDPVIDGDRCSSSTVDRQRNEMKSITNNSTWAKVQGNWDEWQILEWKFKLRPDSSPPELLPHPPAESPGRPEQRRADDHDHAALDGSGATSGSRSSTRWTARPPARARSWTTCRCRRSKANGCRCVRRCATRYDGYYGIKITRISDGAVLIDFTDPNIDMWRIGSWYIRSKFGLYRSLAGGRLDQNPVGQSPLLKNESIWISDFRVYEKNTNPNPGVPHD